MAATPKGMDVVGLDNGSNGRSCVQHSVCGSFVLVDDILYCKWAVQAFDEDGDIPEACVQVYKLACDGHVGCHVGYLPRRVVKASREKDGVKDGGKSMDGLWLKVVKDLRMSENSSERSRSYRNCGIVYCHVANDEWLVGMNPFEKPIKLPRKNEDDDNSDGKDDDDTTCTPTYDDILLARERPREYNAAKKNKKK
jgi:hypothetical protein